MPWPHTQWLSTTLAFTAGLYFGWRWLSTPTSWKRPYTIQNVSNLIDTTSLDKQPTSQDANADTDNSTSDLEVIRDLQRYLSVLRATIHDLFIVLQLNNKYGGDTPQAPSLFTRGILDHLEKYVRRLEHLAVVYELSELRPTLTEASALLETWNNDPTALTESSVQDLESFIQTVYDWVAQHTGWSAVISRHLESVKQTLPGPGDIRGAIQEKTEQARKTWEETLASLAQSALSGTFIETIRAGVNDAELHPEITRDAHVRLGPGLPREEMTFRQVRMQKACKAFANFIRVPEHEVTPDNLPIIALAGSGGGYRAMVSTLGYLTACQKAGILDCTMYMAGVSGSCWTMMQYFVAAEGSMEKLSEHISQQISTSLQSVPALVGALTSPEAASIFAGLVSKYDSGIPLSLVDIYGTLLMARLLTRSLRGPSEFHHIKLTDQQQYLARGEYPMPIYTAVRHEVLQSDGTHTKADNPEQPKSTIRTRLGAALPSLDKLTSALPLGNKMEKDNMVTSASLPSEDDDARSISTTDAPFFSALGLYHTHKYQWFEFTPYEIGTADEEDGVWVPAWAFGRRFERGHSVERLPEPSVGLYLGMFGSAFCATIAHMVDEVKATLATPINQYLESLVKDFQLMVTTTHPIAPSCFHNPFYYPSPAQDSLSHTADDVTTTATVSNTSPSDDIPTTLFSSESLCLMDAGMHNNIPFYPLLRPERQVDVILIFDASSDIDQTPWFARAEQYAKNKGITRWPWGASPWPCCNLSHSNQQTPNENSSVEHCNSSDTTRSTLPVDPHTDTLHQLTEKPNPFASGHRCAIFTRPHPTPPDDAPHFSEEGAPESDFSSRGITSETTKDAELANNPSSTVNQPPISLVYYPLLANPDYEVVDFDPATATFCSTYNFSYTQEQVQHLASLSQYNFDQEVESLRATLRKVWQRKKTK
ncbi:hypothetical protein IWQ61_000826 [Dispira simplex]|nr:hypothetical protein IWQ61_000826 [Dispira simplex]